jgi:hypothetical protein
MADQLSGKEMIDRLLADAHSTEDVHNLVPCMGQMLVLQLAFPVAVFGNDGRNWSPTGKFTNITQGIIQPSPICDRVMITTPEGAGMLVKASDIQNIYVLLKPEEKSRIIRPGAS